VHYLSQVRQLNSRTRIALVAGLAVSILAGFIPLLYTSSQIASDEPTGVKRDKNQGTSGDPV